MRIVNLIAHLWRTQVIEAHVDLAIYQGQFTFSFISYYVKFVEVCYVYLYTERKNNILLILSERIKNEYRFFNL